MTTQSTDASLPSGGRVRPITRWGASVMHAPCAPVTSYDRDLANLVADLVATMYAADGVGLAANQVGVALSVFVFDCPGITPDGVEDAVRGVVCNPRLTLADEDDQDEIEAEEGCLSLPGAFIACTRPAWARVDGFDQTGAPVVYEGSGLLARCLQHESDHLVGTVFADHLHNRRRRKLLKEGARLAHEYPDEWPVVRALG